MPDLTGNESTVKPDAPEAITQVVQQVPEIIKESREGYKTTEFWVTIAISILTLLNGIPMPDKYEGFVVAALGAAYALSRGVAKKGTPHIEITPPA